jgi:hypothetical protein
MKKSQLILALATSLLLFNALSTTAVHAALLARDFDNNINTIEGWYDTVLKITWLADADYARTSGFDQDGKLAWTGANTWAAGLTIDGIMGWRLPQTGPVDGVAIDYAQSNDGSTDNGFNISAPGSAYPGSTGSELAYMFYNTLGNLGRLDLSGNTQAGYGLVNTGPFSNLHADLYWSGARYALTSSAWDFNFIGGFQGSNLQTSTFYAWLVHDGDVGAAIVPIPAAAWLFVSGLLGLIGVARRRNVN